MLDSGAPINVVSTPIAEAFNAAFDPPAVFNGSVGAYVTLCSAKAPGKFAVKIGGQTFTTEAADQLFPLQLRDDQGRDLCVSGTADGGSADDGGNIFVLSVFSSHLSCT